MKLYQMTLREILGALVIAVVFTTGALAQTAQTVTLKELNVRDPYILADQKTKTYFLYKAATVKNGEGKTVNGVVAYKSTDLMRWEGPVTVFAIPENNWITGAVWAPEVHFYRGGYYLFATLNSDLTWKKRQQGWPSYTFRGTQIFHAKSPSGPFIAFSMEPHTPMDRMALDGTLWVEDKQPYMVYCHEWVQVTDGTMELVKLKKDLSAPAGPSQTLFHASGAPWSTGDARSNGLPTSYVTDGCFLYRSQSSGKLWMIWSSFRNGSYAIGLAESVTGKVTGPWKQFEKPLLERDGGHGMLFRTFDGRLMLTIHGPNSPSGEERALIYEIEDTGETLRVGELVHWVS